MSAREVEAKFVDMLQGIEVNGDPYLSHVGRAAEQPRSMPALLYMYRPHQQGGGLSTRQFGLETGVPEFLYSWIWELYISVSRNNTDEAQEQFIDFDYGLAMALFNDPSLGGACYGTSLSPLTDPSIVTEDKRRYLYVPMTFTATVEEGN